jgi:glutamine amidotransferase
MSSVKQTCAIIDYGMGNLHSAHGALEKIINDQQLNIDIVVTSDPDVIKKSDRVVLPGVGAIRDCITEIRSRGIDQVIFEVAQTKPLLGICVGMQALMSSSEENQGVQCLGLFDGDVKFFGKNIKDQEQYLKVPHMGWNQVDMNFHPLWNNITNGSRFYFVHSY